MLKVTTETGSIYRIKNGRITRVPSETWDIIEFEVNNDLFKHRGRLEVGYPMEVQLIETDRPIRTSNVVNIEKED